LKASSKEIKPFLLDQRLVAGIGNIYASEILFASGVLPQRSSHSLKKKEVQAIVENTRRILLSAIEYNGTSVSDFRQVDEKTGEFQNFLQVYDKESQSCPRCEVPLQRIVQQQRSTFFCIGCQK
jgi:formamidopyrimidine-DNA glycosylase